MTPQDALVHVLIAHPRLVRTNTPLGVLADHMLASLKAFEDSLLARSRDPFFHPGRERTHGDQQGA